jgi:hypothetical protein
MKIEVPFKNTKTAEIRKVKVGWSWTLFFFSGWLGVPLFMRKLNRLGMVFLGLWGSSTILQFSMGRGNGSEGLAVIVFLIAVGLSIWIGVKGNELTAKNYLNAGWQFAEPDSEATRFGKLKWGISR